MKFLSLKIQARNSLAIQCLGFCASTEKHRLDLWWENLVSHTAEQKRKKERKPQFSPHAFPEEPWKSRVAWAFLNLPERLYWSYKELSNSLPKGAVRTELWQKLSVGSWGLWGAAWPNLGRSEMNFWRRGEVYWVLKDYRVHQNWSISANIPREQTQKPKAVQKGHVLIEE